ncbi:nuclear transport factor 2 family protein [Streptomyces sp. NPDC051219]|uniref:nuclear transport factor 2 family protein n=1 Tax=Streptomyces sp. NPDC051219 TaxID=3155283 RepID=UPI0034134FBE
MCLSNIPITKNREVLMNTREMQDRLEIMELLAVYNRACVEVDSEAFADCFIPDGRYIGVNAGWIANGREELKRGVDDTDDGGGIQHTTCDHIFDIQGDYAKLRVSMMLYMRETTSGPNHVWATGFYHDQLRRTADGWRFIERISFIDRKIDAYVVTALQGIVLQRPAVRAAVTDLLGVDGVSLDEAIASGKLLSEIARSQGVEPRTITVALAKQFQELAPAANPLENETALGIAHVMVNGQPVGADLEKEFRSAAA